MLIIIPNIYFGAYSEEEPEEETITLRGSSIVVGLALGCPHLDHPEGPELFKGSFSVRNRSLYFYSYVSALYFV